jgi:hypothetical protein
MRHVKSNDDRDMNALISADPWCLDAALKDNYVFTCVRLSLLNPLISALFRTIEHRRFSLRDIPT